ncbi:MAG: glycogen/starch/alpha-glucan phosphorylase [Gomphosphaeria aponina SAG 52.96 = DSM 107014]|uniref:Alpha-1,4 glucan phosphorylase n=1 Tax=Gomphosphaeria aponina SAG 52.96 = DSM 107014 TaxID=1521640 RepID=A0A941GP12_9CHRO|nr:glycogen/starch/alpha-glucan phosphorylase [Gomphosphaeria aponina SAG 52.96 = DSM 107014]
MLLTVILGKIVSSKKIKKGEPVVNQLEKNTAQANIQIEDDRTGMDLETLKRAFADNLFYLQGKYQSIATPHDYYMALAYTVRDRLLHRFIKTVQTYSEKQEKVVCYLSAEFLMGRHLGNNLINLDIYEKIHQAVKESGQDLDQLIEQEPDPGLGNGGLGRLAACFLDSLATLEIPAIGYGIRYEFGIFHQFIKDGWQAEVPDNWLRFGNPWEIPRYNQTVEVKLGGHTEEHKDPKGHYCVTWIPERVIIAIPYDTPVPGYKTNTVNPLRLWKAEASESFNFEAFNAGNYDRAVEEKMNSETISKVLYPNDNTPQGRELRLAQQYFFVSASLQDLIRIHLQTNENLDNLHEGVAIQLNDTHPAVAIAELMRLLIDEHGVDWDQAWRITQKTFAYTNHTLLPEALERWSASLFAKLLPRHLEIIYEINHRFLEDVRVWFPHDEELVSRLSIIEEGEEQQVRMAHLACVGSHSINGVAALHTELLKKDTLRDFAALWPEKFYNKTNGVTPRRWILLSNPKLADLFTEKVGEGWIKNLEQLRGLEKFIEDPDFCDRWRKIKQENKSKLAAYILKQKAIEVNVDSIFDVQVKRIHEYKRQHLMVLYIIALYNRIKENPSVDIVPRTFIFGGKAAPGYFTAKLIIKLINSVAEVVNKDPDVKGRLKVVFIANFNVSLGQKIYPAADLSEQISTAGKEASGTGNMKFAMNGALTIGTLDGANIEIREEAGVDNFFLFGLTAEEVYTMKANGYNPKEYYQKNPELKAVIDKIANGYFSHGDLEMFKPIIDSLMSHDQYMLFADYQAYVDCQDQVSQAYRDQEKWTKMSILNSARMAKFSSDRTIREYCEQIWKVKPVKIELEAYDQKVAGLNPNHV